MSSVDILEAVDPLSHNLKESDPAVLQLEGARWVDRQVTSLHDTLHVTCHVLHVILRDLVTRDVS